MSSLPTIVAPDVKEEEQLRPQFQEEVHEKLKDRWNPWIVIPNVRFHKPNHFLDRTISIKSARLWWSSPLWLTVAVLFAIPLVFSRFLGFLGPLIYLFF